MILVDRIHRYRTVYVESESEVAQSCLTLCDPVDCSLPGFSIHGILQARPWEWVARPLCSAWKWKVKSLIRVWLFATPWTAAYQAPQSMVSSRQEYWSGVPLPSPGPSTHACAITATSQYLILKIPLYIISSSWGWSSANYVLGIFLSTLHISTLIFSAASWDGNSRIPIGDEETETHWDQVNNSQSHS